MGDGLTADAPESAADCQQWHERLGAGSDSVPVRFVVPRGATGWVVAGGPSSELTTAELCRVRLASMVVDLPKADIATLAGWVHLAATRVRADFGDDLSVAYLGAGRAAAAGWVASLGGQVDGVMAWNARPWEAWSQLPSVGVPSLLVVDETAPWLLPVAKAARWRLGSRADVVARAPAGDVDILSSWYHDRLLHPSVPAVCPPSTPATRRRMASIGVAAALGVTPAGLLTSAVATTVVAGSAAAASLPDFSAGSRLGAAQIGGDNQANVARRGAQTTAGPRLSAAQIGGDGKATGPRGDPPIVDGIGMRWHVNTNIGFATSSSASGAVSEAEFTHAVAATTLNGGTVNATLNDAFDGYNALCIDVNNVGGQCNTGNMASYNQNGPSTLECSNRQVVLPPKTMGNFSVRRKVFVPSNDGFARWLDIVTNNSANPQTVRLVTSNNLGSDSGTRIVTTSDGDATPELTDTWVTTFQNYSGTTSPDVRLGHVLRGLGAPVGLAVNNFVNGDDNPFWRYEFQLAPGQTGIIMNFATGQASNAASATESAGLASLSNANALACMTPTEVNEVVNFLANGLASPTISTQASAGGPVGTSVTDTATVAGGASPTGNVTFRLFTDPACSSQVFASTNALAGGSATSASFQPGAPGTYYWTAVYNGDPNNNTATSACNAPNESVTITKGSPTISTQASAGGLVGTSVTDTATVAGGASPTGNVTFRLFTDPACSSQVFATTNALAGGSATSSSFTPAAPGTYYWTAVYNGDPNNNTATSPCNAPNESVTITPFVGPTCTTTLTGTVNGPVTVNAGQSVCVNGALVIGAVTVNPGGALTVTTSRIYNGIVANNPSFFSLCGSKVYAPQGNPAQGVVVSNASVPLRIGDPANGCALNEVAGDVTLTGTAAAITLGGNKVTGNVTVNNTTGPAVIKANQITKVLGCAGNNPPPANAGQPNTALGGKTGQCAGL